VCVGEILSLPWFSKELKMPSKLQKESRKYAAMMIYEIERRYFHLKLLATIVGKKRTQKAYKRG
jgi:hypothetical protein